MELVLRREDAATFGLAEPLAGDILFFLKPDLPQAVRLLSGEPVGQTASIAAGSGASRSSAGMGVSERGLYENCSGEHHGFFPAASRGLGSVRAATFFYGRSVPNGLRLPTPIEIVDLAPTICQLLELSPLRGADGRVLWEVMRL